MKRSGRWLGALPARCGFGFGLALLVLLLAACAGNRPAEQRSNRPMAPGSIVGGPSSLWDVPARLLSGDAPVYPIGQLLTGKTGHAKVAFVVAEDGTTRDIAVGEATNAVFGRHAAIAVSGWRFAPATKQGRPVASQLVVDLGFDIARNFDVPPSPSDRR